MSYIGRAYREEFAGVLKKMIHDACKKEEYHTLVVGLGNRDVTPDALGPRVVDNLFITRHMVKKNMGNMRLVRKG